MARVIVVPDPSKATAAQATIVMDETVESVHLSDEHCSLQFIERLAWAISDAEVFEREQRASR